ncbi:hypothetical protein BC829DRAFT_169473 [Chytridium lagenaria]|nr:hypothetical protein BC829DRAFT_169473 [Chytridium lagenaria]
MISKRRDELVAFIVPKPNVALDVSALVTFLRERLSASDLPTLFAVAEEGFPRMDCGDIDVGRLPVPVRVVPDTDKGEFMDAQEKVIYDTVSKLVGIPTFSIHTNIFHIHGTDLPKISAIISRIRHALTLPIPIRYIFENPTVSTLSTAITQFKEDVIDLGGTIATGEQERDMLIRKDFHTTHLHKPAGAFAKGIGRTLLQMLGVLILFIINIITSHQALPLSSTSTSTTLSTSPSPLFPLSTSHGLPFPPPPPSS